MGAVMGVAGGGDDMPPRVNMRVIGTCSMAAIICILLLQGDAVTENAEVAEATETQSHAAAQAEGCGELSKAKATSMLEQVALKRVLRQRQTSARTATRNLSAEERVVAEMEAFRQEEHAKYIQLRGALRGELTTASQKFKNYNKLRTRAIQAERYCSTHKVSVCSDGKRIEDTPDCHQVVKEDPSCKQARLLATRAAQHAPVVRHLKWIKAQLLRAEDEAMLMTKESKHQLEASRVRVSQRLATLQTAQSLVQQAQKYHTHLAAQHAQMEHLEAQLLAGGHCVKDTKLNAAIMSESSPRHPMTVEQLKELRGILAAYKALPSTPWRLSQQAKVSAELEDSFQSSPARRGSTWSMRREGHTRSTSHISGRSYLVL